MSLFVAKIQIFAIWNLKYHICVIFVIDFSKYLNFIISGDQILTKPDKDQNHNGMISLFFSQKLVLFPKFILLIPWKILLFPCLSFSPILSKIPPIFSPSISHDRLLICYCLSLDKMLISPSFCLLVCHAISLSRHLFPSLFL